ncbi:MAG: molybdenum cofactor biosynthesis protein MoaE [Promethearchaeota archaeon]
MNHTKDIIIKSGIYNKGEIKLNDIIEFLKNQNKIIKAGALLTFSGIVRADSKGNKNIKGMKIDAYKELANKTIIEICKIIKEKYGLIDIILVHFMGKFGLSEDLVHVVVASSHRDEGFKALREAVEMYKKKLPIWKCEEFSDGTAKWIH